MRRQAEGMALLRNELLEWFDAKQRDLPWRVNRDPYRIWVSEIMLQQTQVQTAIGYYEGFMKRFPTVEELAKACVEEVLALWAGLGYYRRARWMHAAARQIVVDSEGFPSSSRELLKLPGIGAYTAAAVASMAFDEMIPVLDGNVERVLCRRLAIDRDPKQQVTRRLLLEAAKDLLDSERPGDSNQALMEVGATVCRPRRTDCEGCPLRRGCLARLAGRPYHYPPPRRRRQIERIDLVVAVVRQDETVLLFRRSDGRRVLAGMWELPNVERQSPIKDLEDAFARRYGGCWKLDEETYRARHGITHRAYTLHAHLARFTSEDGLGEGPEAAWVPSDNLARLPMSSMVGKVLAGC